MNQKKTKKTLIFLILFLALVLAIIFIFKELNKNREELINNLESSKTREIEKNKDGKIKDKEIKEDVTSKVEEIINTEERKVEILDSLNFNIAQLLVMEGYLENELIFSKNSMIGEGKALFEYKYKGKDLKVEVDFSDDAGVGLMLKDYRVLNNGLDSSGDSETSEDVSAN